MMAASGNNNTKNPKTRKIRKLMDEESLEESFSNDKKYPPEDLSE
jgi:hypothetical protein